MERVTFPVPAVKEALQRFELCELDVDVQANRPRCDRFLRGDGTPTFVALDRDGVELARWTGAPEPDALVAKLDGIKDDLGERLAAAGDDHGARAEIFAARGDVEKTLQELGELSRHGGADAAAAFERGSWLLCETLRDQQRWPDLERAARHYLESCPDGPHAGAARVASGLAAFEQTGVTSPDLQAHIDRLVAALGEPIPKRSLGDRFLRLIGMPDESSERRQVQAAGEWCDRLNSTMDELARIGRAALPALQSALRDGGDVPEGVADHAATVIGWIRDPASRVFLRDLLDHAELSTTRRTAVVRSLGLQKDAADLPRMLAIAASDAAPGVRAEAVEAIRSLCERSGGTTDRAIADALSDAIASRDFMLRSAALQAMFEVHAPLALDRLIDVLDDERGIFADYRMCDNALWILEDQIDQHVVDRNDSALERCTPAVARFLDGWYAQAKAHLRWDAAQARWIDDSGA